MREIKFRGRDKNGIWHVGNLLITENMVSAKTGILTSRKMKDDWYEEITYVVDPDTVGQFSGIELSYHELYEGDILEIDVLYDDSTIEKIRGVVGFNIGFFSFHEIGEKSRKWILSQIASSSIGVDKYLGNIHDNPELLGEKG